MLLAAGGTAGHVVPALAVAAELRRRGCEVQFVGSRHGLERELVRRAGYPMEILPARPWQGRSIAERLGALAVVPVSVFSARRFIRMSGAEGVIGFGGFVSVGAVIAAHQLGLWCAIVEPNVAFGMANRWLASRADRLYTSTLTQVPPSIEARAFRCGVPLRDAISSRFSLTPVPPVERAVRILVLADSTHSDFLDRVAPELAVGLRGRGVNVEVLHQSPAADADSIRAKYAGVSVDVRQYIDDVGAAYAAADFVIARCGASTLAELSACGLPALLVPLSRSAEGHQSRNAAPYGEAGAAVVVEERAWRTADLVERVAAIVTDPERWMAMSSHTRRFAVADATASLVRDVESQCPRVRA